MKTKNKNKKRLFLNKEYITSLDTKKVTGGRIDIASDMGECETHENLTRMRCHTDVDCELET